MSFCFLYNVVLENHSVQNSPGGGGGGGRGVYCQLKVYKYPNRLNMHSNNYDQWVVHQGRKFT